MLKTDYPWGKVWDVVGGDLLSFIRNFVVSPEVLNYACITSTEIKKNQI